MLAAIVCWLSLFAQETPAAIEAAAAANQVGKEITVRMEVASARALPEQTICLLNSLKDHRDPQVFTVVLQAGSLQELAALNILDPVEFFMGRKLAVTGTVRLFRGKPQMEIRSLDQIRVVVPNRVPAAADRPAPKPGAIPAKRADSLDHADAFVPASRGV